VTDDGVGAEQLSGCRDGKVGLSDMHAVRVRHQGDVNAIVDDHGCLVRSGQPDGGGTKIAERTGCQVLGADLQELRTAVEERLGQVQRRPAGACRRVDVENGLERGDAHHTEMPSAMKATSSRGGV